MGLTKNDIYNNVTTDFTVGDHIRNTTDSVTTSPSSLSDFQISTDIYSLSSILFKHPLSIDVQNGWNTISYPHPYEGNLQEQLYASIFNTSIIPSHSDISEALYDYFFLVKNNNGQAYLPEYNFNGIGNFIPGQGYQIKAKKPFHLSFPIFINGSESEKTQFISQYGTPEKYTAELNSTPINLSYGWNIIGYNRLVERDVVEELTDPNGPGSNLTISTDIEVSDIIIIKNNVGKAYLPEFEFNGIEKFLPGQGYPVKTNRAVSFNWTDITGFPSDNNRIEIYLQSPQASTSDQNSINQF